MIAGCLRSVILGPKAISPQVELYLPISSSSNQERRRLATATLLAPRVLFSKAVAAGPPSRGIVSMWHQEISFIRDSSHGMITAIVGRTILFSWTCSIFRFYFLPELLLGNLITR